MCRRHLRLVQPVLEQNARQHSDVLGPQYQLALGLVHCSKHRESAQARNLALGLQQVWAPSKIRPPPAEQVMHCPTRRSRCPTRHLPIQDVEFCCHRWHSKRIHCHLNRMDLVFATRRSMPVSSHHLRMDSEYETRHSTLAFYHHH